MNVTTIFFSLEREVKVEEARTKTMLTESLFDAR